MSKIAAKWSSGNTSVPWKWEYEYRQLAEASKLPEMSICIHENCPRGRILWQRLLELYEPNSLWKSFQTNWPQERSLHGSLFKTRDLNNDNKIHTRKSRCVQNKLIVVVPVCGTTREKKMNVNRPRRNISWSQGISTCHECEWITRKFHDWKFSVVWSNNVRLRKIWKLERKAFF